MAEAEENEAGGRLMVRATLSLEQLKVTRTNAIQGKLKVTRTFT
jgi:hypothetical protein